MINQFSDDLLQNIISFSPEIKHKLLITSKQMYYLSQKCNINMQAYMDTILPLMNSKLIRLQDMRYPKDVEIRRIRAFLNNSHLKRGLFIHFLYLIMPMSIVTHVSCLGDYRYLATQEGALAVLRFFGTAHCVVELTVETALFWGSLIDIIFDMFTAHTLAPYSRLTQTYVCCKMLALRIKMYVLENEVSVLHNEMLIIGESLYKYGTHDRYRSKYVTSKSRDEKLAGLSDVELLDMKKHIFDIERYIFEKTNLLTQDDFTLSEMAEQKIFIEEFLLSLSQDAFPLISDENMDSDFTSEVIQQQEFIEKRLSLLSNVGLFSYKKNGNQDKHEKEFGLELAALSIST